MRDAETIDCNPIGIRLAADGSSSSARAQGEGRNEPLYTIRQLAKQFGVTLRALRFYENQGLLTPLRQGRQRRYTRADVERLAIILKAKKFGFSLAECRQMIMDGASPDTLKLTREKCLRQIDILERKLAEIAEALAELRRISTSF